MIKAIIFDCFGVVFQDNFGALYEHFGGNLEQDKEFISDIMHRGSRGEIINSSEIFVDHLGVSMDEWNDARNDMDNVGLDYELLGYIKELSKSYKVGMLSNVGTDGLSKYMDYGVLEEHFDVIIESAKIGFAKPEARAYEIAADRLGIRLDECVFVDDREEYIEGAQHVGMRTILFENFTKFKVDLEKLLK